MATTWKVESLTVSRLSDEQVIARWKFETGSTTDYFAVRWSWYSESKKMWVIATTSDQHVPTSQKSGGYFQCTYSVPQSEDAVKVRVYVRPWATQNSTGSYYWQSAGVYADPIANPWVIAQADEQRKRALAKPDAPTNVRAEMTASGNAYVEYDCDAEYATKVNVYRSDCGAAWALIGTVAKTAGSYTDKSVVDGHTYRYRFKSSLANGTLSDYSEIAGPVYAKPAKASGLKARALTSESVRLDWVNEGRTGDYYWVEWTDDYSAWKDNDDSKIHRTSDIPEPGTQRHTVSGLESGKRWYFRVGRGNDAGKSNAWAGGTITVSALLGTVPEAPTVGTTPSALTTDDSLTMSWTHNSEDKSEQSAYQVEITVNGTARTRSGTTASELTLTMASIGAGDAATVTWRVRTKGVLDTWGAWSKRQTVKVWATLSVGLAITKNDGSDFPDDPQTGRPLVTTYPFRIKVDNDAAGWGNKAIQWYGSITSDDDIPYIGRDGEDAWTFAGEAVWSYQKDVDEAEGYAIDVKVQWKDVALVDGARYTVRFGCVTRQGMRCEAEPLPFVFGAGTAEFPAPFANFEFDPESLACTIWPWCYRAADPEEPDVPGTRLRSYTLLAVYRIMGDGEAVLIAENIKNAGKQWVIDPHPSFGTCRYRIVATDTQTGAQNATEGDVETPFESICIQWGDDFFLTEGQDGTSVATSGTRVVLPYNLQVNESYAPDVALREYAGRRAPVAYYGTQRGARASWTADLAKDIDADALGLLRRLARTMEDVYVREPSGTGYWAHAEVSGISHAHNTSSVGAQISVTAVDHGGDA